MNPLPFSRANHVTRPCRWDGGRGEMAMAVVEAVVVAVAARHLRHALRVDSMHLDLLDAGRDRPGVLRHVLVEGLGGRGGHRHRRARLRLLQLRFGLRRRALHRAAVRAGDRGDLADHLPFVLLLDGGNLDVLAVAEALRPRRVRDQLLVLLEEEERVGRAVERLEHSADVSFVQDERADDGDGGAGRGLDAVGPRARRVGVGGLRRPRLGRDALHRAAVRAGDRGDLAHHLAVVLLVLARHLDVFAVAEADAALGVRDQVALPPREEQHRLGAVGRRERVADEPLLQEERRHHGDGRARRRRDALGPLARRLGGGSGGSRWLIGSGGGCWLLGRRRDDHRDL